MKTNLNDILWRKYSNDFVTINDLERPIEVIKTGNYNFDKILGCDGIPKSRITEIFGNESSGKTTIALQIAKEVTLKREKVLYIDLECTLDIKYLKSLGIDINYIYICRPKSGEKTFSIIEDSLKEDQFSLIIVDSVAAMTTENELDENIEDNARLGALARLMSKGLRRIQNMLNLSNTALIFINQIRERIGVLYGNPETTTGGKALRFFATIRIEVKKADLIKNGQDKIGIKAKLTIVKNKLGKPFEYTYINIYFGEGYDYTLDILDFAIENNIIKKSGSWFYFNDEKLCQGMNKLKIYCNENPEWLNNIKNIIEKKIDIVN